MNLYIKKIFKRVVITILCIVVILISTMYFTLQYRVGYLLKKVVDSKTSHTYSLDFSTVTVALFKGKILLKNAVFQPTKSIAGKTAYRAEIPKLYFSLGSWNQLLFHKKLIVDSIDLKFPDLKIFMANNKMDNEKTGIETSKVYEILKMITTRLNVKVLNIDGAVLSFYGNAKPFSISHLTLSVRNFSNSNSNTHRLLSTDEIELNIGRQNWVLPNGNIIAFKNLYFSAATQHLQLDSCMFVSAPTALHPVDIRADVFVFIAANLDSAYITNQLLVDTLFCYHPVLNLAVAKKNSHDTSDLLSGSFKYLFDDIRFKYINVLEGQLSVTRTNNNAQTSYTTKKTDLHLYDLDVDSRKSPSFSIGNIDLHVDSIRFFSPDSLYALDVRKFGFYDNDLVCKEASFIPLRNDVKNIGMHSKLPQFILKRVSLPDLLQKNLKAEYAELDAPEFFLTTSKPNANNAKNSDRINGLYKVLHGFGTVVNVGTMFLRQGNLYFKSKEASIVAKNMNATIRLNSLFESGSLLDIKKAIPEFSCGSIKLISNRLKTTIENLYAQGMLQKNQISHISLDLPGGKKIKADGIAWKKLNWDLLYQQGKLDVDSLGVRSFFINYTQTKKIPASETKPPPIFKINKINLENIETIYIMADSSAVKARGHNIIISDLSNANSNVQWQSMHAILNDITYRKDLTEICADSLAFDSGQEMRIKNMYYATKENRINIPELKLNIPAFTTKFSDFHLQYLVLNDPYITVNASTTKEQKSPARFSLPMNINADRVEINNALIRYNNHSGDSLSLAAMANIMIDSLNLSKSTSEQVHFQSSSMHFHDLEMMNKKIFLGVPSLQVHLGETNSSILSGRWNLNSEVSCQWRNALLKFRDSSTRILRAGNISGEFNNPSFTFSKGEKLSLLNIAQNIKLSDGNFHFENASTTVTSNGLQWNQNKNTLQLYTINVTPNISRDAFFTNSPWQKDFISITCDKLTLDNIDLAKYAKDSILHISHVALERPVITTARDKNIPFNHGSYKLMPTKLIEKIKRPFFIDSLIVKNGSVTINEISDLTKREGTIPLHDVNVVVRDITNQPQKSSDSLSVVANGIFLDSRIRKFEYKESYDDSLSGFRLMVRASPMDLTTFTAIMNPLAAVNIENGKSDTLYAFIAGNKYAAFGQMNFYYRHLKVRILNNTDTARKGLALSVKNLVANKIVIKSNNKKSSKIFFVRDPEKFVFNYWIKTNLSGVITSTGIKRNKKYQKMYDELKDEYSLPPKTN